MWLGSAIRTVKSFLLLWLLLYGSTALAVAPLEVTFLDVGEGEAVYIRTPDGKSLLVDAANPATAERIVRFLNSRGVDTLQAVLITHPHPDHMGGIFQLLSTFRVKRVYDNGQPIDDMPRCDIYRWYKERVRALPHYRRLGAGNTLRYGNVTVEVLWPVELRTGGWNQNSLVLKISYSGRVFLLMGDADEKVEAALIERESSLEADVLKAGHHGSEGTLSERFLREVLPSYAVISINRDNLRGYPSKKVLKRLDEMKITTLITYRDGNISFLVDEKGGLRLVHNR